MTAACRCGGLTVKQAPPGIGVICSQCRETVVFAPLTPEDRARLWMLVMAA